MKFVSKLLIFVAILFIATQIFFAYAFPSRYVYNERVNYDVFKDNVYTFEQCIKKIRATIDNENLKDYIIFVGDSVGYGTPCPPDKTISSYMNLIAKKENKKTRIFNLALPSTMFGDLYTILLLCDKYGISTQNVILDFSYWEINAKRPAYWFNYYLKELDNDSYNKMVKMKYIEKESIWQSIKSQIQHWANNNIYLISYSGFTVNKIKSKVNQLMREPVTQLKVWKSKPYVIESMKKQENRWYFSDAQYNFSETSSQLYFMNKIAEHQKGKNTIYFMTALNKELLPVETSKPGLKKNVKSINKYFEDKKLNYVNYEDKIDYSFFSDHVHLLPEGYKLVAGDLWNRFNKEKY